jgi:hypothetical protein
VFSIPQFLTERREREEEKKKEEKERKKIKCHKAFGDTKG